MGGLVAAAELNMLASQVALASAQKMTASMPSTGQLPGPTTLNVVPMQRRLEQQREERLQAMSRGNTLAMTLGVPIQSLKVKPDGRVALVSSGNENVELELPASMVSRFGGHHPGDDPEAAAVEVENGPVEGAGETHQHSGNDSREEVVVSAGNDTQAAKGEAGPSTPATATSASTTMLVDVGGPENTAAVPAKEGELGKIAPNGVQMLQPPLPGEASCGEGTSSQHTTDSVQAPPETIHSPACVPVTTDVAQATESAAESEERGGAGAGSGQSSSTPGQDGSVEPQEQPQPTESPGARLEERALGECETGQGGAKSSRPGSNSASSNDRMMDRLNAIAVRGFVAALLANPLIFVHRRLFPAPAAIGVERYSRRGRYGKAPTHVGCSDSVLLPWLSSTQSHENVSGCV
jgi:hypothetical protein